MRRHALRTRVRVEVAGRVTRWHRCRGCRDGHERPADDRRVGHRPGNARRVRADDITTQDRLPRQLRSFFTV